MVWRRVMLKVLDVAFHVEHQALAGLRGVGRVERFHVEQEGIGNDP